MRKKGFTLIELLVVISIIGVLATLIIANFNAARERARDVQRKSDLRQIKTALRLYYNDMTTYPASNGDNDILGCGDDGTDLCEWDGETAWQRDEMLYIKILPQDSQFDSDDGVPTYQYLQTDSGQDFCLWATLENTSDEDLTESQTRCGANCSVTEDDYVVCAD